MVGSSDSVSPANVVLNTIVAEAFKEAADELEKADDFQLAVHDMIKKLLTEHRRIIFNGNGYSKSWVKEAARRGLPNISCMVEAIPALTTEKAVKLFETFHVYTKAELESRAEVEYDSYAKIVHIEALAMTNIAGKQIIPAIIRYTARLADSMAKVQSVCPEAEISVQRDLLLEASRRLSEIKAAHSKLVELQDECKSIRSAKERAIACRERLVPAMEELRRPVDLLERIVDKDLWPMPSYGDLLFEV